MADVVAGMAFTNQHTFVFYAATLVPCADPIAVPFDTRRVPQGTDQQSTLRRGLSASSGLLCRTLWAYGQLEGSDAVLPSCPA